MPRYGMLIDLKKCIGCNSCVVACKVEHNAPNAVHLTAILEKEVGRYPNATRVFLPVLCNHCEEPVCVDACPTRATYRREDGIVAIDWDKCIGCKACVEACPYDMRTRVEDDRIVYPDNETVFVNPVFAKSPPRVAVKCDFCTHRVEEGRVPACVEVCPTRARVFGDLADSEDPILGQVRRHYGFRLLEDKGTEPSVYYIA